MECGRQLDRQVGRLRAPENAATVDTDLAERVGPVARGNYACLTGALRQFRLRLDQVQVGGLLAFGGRRRRQRLILPHARTIALLTNPSQPREFEYRDVQNKVQTVGWQLRYLTASSVEAY
jgi:hypothetical protein